MSNFKFTPKKGVLSNVVSFVRASTATAALTAANGLEAARFLNKTITDGLATANAIEEMGMANAAIFFTKQLGKKVTITDIREGNLAELVEKANEINLTHAEKEGQYQIEKRKVKLGKKIAKLERKMAALKGEEQ